MASRDSFETFLREVASTPAAAADAEETSSLDLMRQAVEELNRSPECFSGDPDGVFTYEHPILALAALAYRAGMDLPVATAAPEGADLRKRSIFRWLLTAVHAWRSRNSRELALLGGRTPRAPLAFDREPVRLAVVGDAGYAGAAQSNVLRAIRRRHQEKPFDLVVHLGDTYFAGSEAEVLKNFLAPFAELDVRAVTLCGNHDLYYNAAAFDHALRVLRQPGRYFAIETPHWRVACLDTSFGAADLLRDDALLDKGQLDWLDELLKADGKRVILMSHHFIVSHWATPAATLRAQLADRLRGGRVFAWYWGHEHACAIYAPGPFGFHGACVGNGAFLERWVPSDPRRADPPQWHATGRCTCYRPDGPHFWPHGYLELEVQPDQLLELYRVEGDEGAQRVLKP